MTDLVILGAALAYTVGGIFMKLSQGLTHPAPTIAVYGCFFLGATLQILSMNEGQLGITYIIVLALEAAFAFGFGIFFFNERQTITKYVAIGLIIAGIALLRGAE